MKIRKTCPACGSRRYKFTIKQEPELEVIQKCFVCGYYNEQKVKEKVIK